MLTDHNIIGLLGPEKEKENLEFQIFLKQVKDNITPLLSEIYRIVREEMDCTSCASCCKKLRVSLSHYDVERLASGLGMEVVALKEQYLTTDLRGNYTFIGGACPFLKDNKCSCYDHRPEECVSYPHLDNINYIYKLKTVLVDCSLCPIVYNVFESLKEILDFRKSFRPVEKENAGLVELNNIRYL